MFWFWTLHTDAPEVRGHMSPVFVFQYEDLAQYGLDGVGGVYGDPHLHHHHHHAAAARSLQAVHLAAGPYRPHQYPQSTHTNSGVAHGDKDAIYG